MNDQPSTGRSPYAARKHDHHNPLAGGKVVPSKALDATGEPSSETFLRGDDTWAEIRVTPAAKAGFDPNEDPVIIGAGANTTDGGTPDNPGASAFTNLVVIGHNASGGASYQVVIGSGASATGDSTLAIGIGANAVADSSTAVGESANTSGLRSVAVGTNANGSGDDGTAVGAFANAVWSKSTAIGASATTNKANQIMLGTAATFAEIPGDSSTAPNGLVLKDTATGTRHIVQITSGALVLNAAP